MEWKLFVANCLSHLATSCSAFPLGFFSEQSAYRPAHTSAPMRKPADNSQALAAFIARKAAIDAILERLTALSADLAP